MAIARAVCSLFLACACVGWASAKTRRGLRPSLPASRLLPLMILHLLRQSP